MCTENKSNISASACDIADDKDTYDHVGAMQYIIAVIIVYSGAVTAMFIVRIFSKRLWVAGKYDQDYDTDRFLKTMPEIRVKLEQEKKQRTIEQLEKFHNFRLKSVKDTSVFGRNIMPLLAMPVAVGGLNQNFSAINNRPIHNSKLNHKDLEAAKCSEVQPLTVANPELTFENETINKCDPERETVV